MKLFRPDAASIGIIGGADGPTAIFVTGSFARPALIVCGLILIAVIIFLLIRRGKK